MPEASVLYLTDTLNSGGAERQLTELALRLDRSCFSPRIFTYAEGDFFRQRLQQGGVPVYQIRRRGKFDPRPVLRLSKWLHDGEVDLIHAFADIPNAYGILAKKVAGRGKVIASVRSAADKGRSALDWQIKGWAHRNADLTISNNEAGLRRVASHAHLNPEQILCLPNGIDLSHFQPATPAEKMAARERLNLVAEDMVFLSLGTIYWRKNYAGYMRALQTLNVPSYWKFVWVGRGQNEELLRDLKQQIAAHDMEQNFVINAESVADVLSLYHAADVLVLNSLSEGMPNVVLEAMACGLPVIATDVGDISKLVIKGKTGWLIPPDVDAELAHAISGAAHIEHNRRAAWGRQARQHLLQLGLDIESIVKSHERIYKEVLGR